MSIEYIRESYGVPAQVGGKVLFRGEPAVIVGSKNGYLELKNGADEKFLVHPTWEMVYIDDFIEKLERQDKKDEEFLGQVLPQTIKTLASADALIKRIEVEKGINIKIQSIKKIEGVASVSKLLKPSEIREGEGYLIGQRAFRVTFDDLSVIVCHKYERERFWEAHTQDSNSDEGFLKGGKWHDAVMKISNILHEREMSNEN